MTNSQNFLDVGIIGAGLAGLTCARHLQQLGLKVIVLEKSKGVGGRVSTRRLHDTSVDHGLPYLTPQGEHTQALIEKLSQNNIAQPWTAPVTQWPTQPITDETPPESRYICPSGMTAIAKYLAVNLEVWREFRVTRLTPTEAKTWLIEGETLEDRPTHLEARAIIMAIPAPQALMLLKDSAISGFDDNLSAQLATVEYDACLSIMAGYSSDYLQTLEQMQPFKPFDVDINRISLESSKRSDAKQPVFILQTSPAFTEKYLDTDNLEAVGQEVLNRANQIWFSWLNSPQWFQVHRWRYAFPRQGLAVPCLLTTSPLPLVCCGDWCQGGTPSDTKNYVEQAIQSGLAAAEQIHPLLVPN